MERDFWLNRWETNQIRFHWGVVNDLLVDHLADLAPPANGRIFVPLCGKTLDIGWLLMQGYRVVGSELSPLAVEQLFDELAVKPVVTPMGPLQRHTAWNLDIFLGDIFDLTPQALARVDAIYDRAALIALPPEMRERYARHLVGLTRAAPQLLLSYEDEAAGERGPPFSVTGAEIARLYGRDYTITELARHAIGQGDVLPYDSAWLLR